MTEHDQVSGLLRELVLQAAAVVVVVAALGASVDYFVVKYSVQLEMIR